MSALTLPGDTGIPDVCFNDAGARVYVALDSQVNSGPLKIKDECRADCDLDFIQVWTSYETRDLMSTRSRRCRLYIVNIAMQT